MKDINSEVQLINRKQEIFRIHDMKTLPLPEKLEKKAEDEIWQQF